MHWRLRLLAERFSVPLSERSCHNNYLWDGSTLATNYQRETWSEDMQTLLHVHDAIPIDDFTMAHEIAHYVVADPVEREFPEYGMSIGVVGFGATGNLPWATTKQETPEWHQLIAQSDGVLTRREQNFREVCADLLGVYWCDLLGIPVEELARPINKIIASIDDKNSPYSIEEGWQAIVWLRARNLLPERFIDHGQLSGSI